MSAKSIGETPRGESQPRQGQRLLRHLRGRGHQRHPRRPGPPLRRRRLTRGWFHSGTRWRPGDGKARSYRALQKSYTVQYKVYYKPHTRNQCLKSTHGGNNRLRHCSTLSPVGRQYDKTHFSCFQFSGRGSKSSARARITIGARRGDSERRSPGLS